MRDLRVSAGFARPPTHARHRLGASPPGQFRHFGLNIPACHQDCLPVVTAVSPQMPSKYGRAAPHEPWLPVCSSGSDGRRRSGARHRLRRFTGTGVPLPKGFAHMLTHRSWIAGGFAALAVAGASPALAQTLPAVTIGGGLQSSYQYTKPDDADGTERVPARQRPPLRERTGHRQHQVHVQHRIRRRHQQRSACSTRWRRFECLAKFNIWAGRFLPPSDRANLYGPYYAHQWGVYTDGVQDGYPFVFQGRDNGVVYWGQFDKVKVSVGAFDGQSATGRSTVLWRRPRPDRFLGSGGRLLPERHLLRRQEPARHRRRRPGRRAATHGVQPSISCSKGNCPTAAPSPIESEYANYNRLGGYDAQLRQEPGRLRARQLSLPEGGRPGQVRDPRQVRQGGVHARHTTRRDYDQKTTEVNFNYVIKQFNARVMIVLPGHTLQRRAAQFLAGRRRPPDPDVSAFVPSNRSVHARS